GVMVLLGFFIDHARGPEFRPASILLMVSSRVHLPQLANPESTSPEEAFLLLPFTGLIVPIGKESVAGTSSNRWRLHRGNHGLPLRRSPIDFLLKEIHRLLECARGWLLQRVRRSRLPLRVGRENLHCCRRLHPSSNFLHRCHQLILILDRVNSGN